MTQSPPHDTRPEPTPPSAGRLLGLARPYALPLGVATFMLLIGGGAEIITPLVAGKVVDAALIETSLDRLNDVALGLIALFALMGLVTFGEHYLLRATGARMLRSLRTRLFGHLLNQSPEFFHTRRVGELLSRIGSDLTIVQSSLTDRIPAGIQALVRFVGTLVMLLVLQTKLTLVALAVVPPIMLIAVWFGRRIERITTAERDALADTQSVAEEVLTGIRTVQSFVRERDEENKYDGKLGDLVRVQLRNARWAGGFGGLIMFAAFSAFAIVLWYGGRLMLTGELTPGELTAFLLYTFSIAVSVGTLGALYAAYRELRGASARIFEILDTAPAIEDRPTALAIDRSRGEIVLDGLSFRYPDSNDRTALDGIDLRVEPGEVVALVGPSGAGKTTLFSLLLRFHDPSAGVIRLDGVDLRDLRLDDLRQTIGIVPQEILLFSASVEENIRYGRPDASPAEVRQAAIAAAAHEFIEVLPKGYDEMVGERGLRLSAGQRQRIAIARAFLKDPSILLLDEATSSLDPDSEARLQEALTKLLVDRTTLVIAHRLATARLAHRILVLEKGRVVSQGTHDELFESSELYRRYWKLQSLQHDAEASA